MVQLSEDLSLIDKYKKVIESILKNIHLLDCNTSTEKDYGYKFGFNSHIIISECLEFLKAVSRDIGGEILIDSIVGHFLYYGDEETTLSN